MKMNVLFLPLLASLAISASAQVPPATRPETPVSVYVAPFTSRDTIDPEVLSSLRDLFEESFENIFESNGSYIVLNRQTIETILAESQNEAALTSIYDLSAKAKSRLKVAKADGVIFGAVIDDKDSGEVVVTVKLQSFESVLFWTESVTIRRGLIHDRSSRKAAMDQLVHAVPGAAKTGSGTGQSGVEAGDTAAPATIGGPLLGQKAELCMQLDPLELGISGCAVLTWNKDQYHSQFPGFYRFGKRLTEPAAGDLIVRVDRPYRIYMNGITDTIEDGISYRGELSNGHIASGTWTYYAQGVLKGSGKWTSNPLVP